MSEYNSDYFSTQESAQRLDLIHHLIENSEVIPLVRGASGSGKSLLASRLQQTAPENWSVCLITANPAMSPEYLLTDIALCAGWSPMSGDLMGGLVSRYEALRTKGRIPVLLIDDAQTLPPSGLITLLRLYERQQAGEPLVSIVLFANEHIDMLLSTPQLRIMSPQSLQVIDLPPLSREDATAFMHYILQVEGLPAGLELTDAKLNRVYRESKGLPGPLRDAILNALAGEDKAGPEHPKQRWRMLLVIPLVAIVGLMLLFQGEINGLFQRKLDEPPATVAEAPGPAAERRELETEQTKVQAAPTATPSPNADALTSTASDSLKAADDVGMTPTPQPEITFEGETPEPALIEPSQLSEQGLVDGQAEVLQEAESSLQPEQVVADFVPLQPLSGIDEALERQEQATPVQPEQATETPAETAGPVASEPVKALTAQGESGKGSSNQWVMSRPPEHYTIQLLGVENVAALHDFLARHALDERAFYVQVTRDGKPWYPLLWGEFDDREAAAEGAKQLPAGLSKNVWSRSFASLQQLLQK